MRFLTKMLMFAFHILVTTILSYIIRMFVRHVKYLEKARNFPLWQTSKNSLCHKQENMI